MMGRRACIDCIIGELYWLPTQAPAWVIAVLLVVVIGPGEEVFWRGLVQ